MKNIKLPVKLLISLLIIVLLVQKMNKDVLAQIGSQIHASAWVLAILMLFMQIIALTFRWSDLLNLRAHKISFTASLRMTVASQLANTLLITSIGGVVVRIGLATQAGINFVCAVCATVTDRLMTLAALVFLAALVMPSFNHLHSNPLLSVYLPALIVGMVATFVFSALLLRKNMIGFLAANKKLEACIVYLRDLASDVPLLLRILGASLAGQICYFMAVYFIANSTGIDIGFSRLLVVLPVITLIASLPVSVGGWGIREGAFVYGLGLLGVPMETAFLISVQIGMVSIAATIIAGLPALLNPDVRNVLQKQTRFMTRWLTPAAQEKIALLLCIFLGAALQIQYTFGLREDYNGIRLNLGDPALPFAGLFIAASLALKQSMLPRWRIRFGPIWPVAMTAVMTFALFKGYAQAHEFTNWALFNKFTGWIVLMAYFGLGAWLTTNGGSKPVLVFLRSFIAVFLIIATTNLIYLAAHDIGTEHFTTYWIRPLKGLSGNRNAFAFFIVTALSVVTVYHLAGKDLIHRYICPLLWFLLPVVMVYNASRAGFIVMVVLSVLFVITNFRKALKSILLPLLLGLIIVGGVYRINPELVLRENQAVSTQYLVDTVKNRDLSYIGYSQKATGRTGDSMRLRVAHNSLTLWKQSPVTGIGLGSFLRFQISHYPEEKDIALFMIDCTPLWILVEMGLAGIIVFGAFGVFAVQALWTGGKTTDETGLLRRALPLTVLGFSIMAAFHELLYSRHLWFMLGLALACPKEKMKTA